MSTTNHGEPAPTLNSSGSSMYPPSRKSIRNSNLTFEEEHVMRGAAEILEKHELLTWHSIERNESIHQTRVYFERILYGLPGPTPTSVSSISSFEWPEEFKPSDDLPDLRAGMEFKPGQLSRSDAARMQAVGKVSTMSNVSTTATAGSSTNSHMHTLSASGSGGSPERKKATPRKRLNDQDSRGS